MKSGRPQIGPSLRLVSRINGPVKNNLPLRGPPRSVSSGVGRAGSAPAPAPTLPTALHRDVVPNRSFQVPLVFGEQRLRHCLTAADYFRELKHEGLIHTRIPKIFE